jgi:hypothetical protein
VTTRSAWLVAAGGLSLTASLLHAACIAGGPAWYRFFGAGEGMARAAERGEARPALITAGIAIILALWACYSFSGAGLIGRLPLLRVGLVAITAAYLLRGMVLFVPRALGRPDLSPAFLLWSSLVVLAIGSVHAIGTWRAWSML